MVSIRPTSGSLKVFIAQRSTPHVSASGVRGVGGLGRGFAVAGIINCYGPLHGGPRYECEEGKPRAMTTQAAGLTIDVTHDFGGILEGRDTPAVGVTRQEWEELLRSSASDVVFMTWQWQSLWWKHFGAGQGCKLHLLALLPFTCVRLDFASVLTRVSRTLLSNLFCRLFSAFV